MTRFDPGFDRVTQLFSDAGFDAPDAEGRARLLVQAFDAFRRSTERDPAWSSFVPGRIEIFGKHTDYAGGRSLTWTVPRGFLLIAAPREDRRVRVIDARLGEEAVVDLDAPTGGVSGWSRYAEVVARRLAADFPGAPLGVEVAFASDLPRAAGLSSSSALVVGLATALVHRGRLHMRPEWQAALQTLQDLAGYLGAVENGLTFKTFTGAPGVGTDGGSEDHTAILMARRHAVSAYSYLPVRRHADAEMPPDWRFVVATSGVEADKAGSARDQIQPGLARDARAARAAECEDGERAPAPGGCARGNRRRSDRPVPGWSRRNAGSQAHAFHGGRRARVPGARGVSASGPVQHGGSL